MHASVRWYSDGSLADRLAARSDDIRPVIADISGFRGYHIVRTDAGTITVSLFDDEASATASNEAAASWLRDNMPGVAADNVTGGEVVLSF